MAEKHTRIRLLFFGVKSIHSAIEVWDSRKCDLKPQMRVTLLPMFGAKRKWQPLKWDKSTSRDFATRLAASQPKKLGLCSLRNS